MIYFMTNAGSSVFHAADTAAESYIGTTEIVEVEDENQVKPFSMEELTAKYAIMRKHGKSEKIIGFITATISIFSSLTLLWMIRRSHVGLSTTNHRLLLGLCISDIIFSLSSSFLAIWSPSELNYYVWSAMGNTTTCTIQGCVYVFGMCMATFYNCSLNCYYLAVVKYEKSDEYIRKKIEPFLHGVPITISLIIVVTRLFNDNYNDFSAGSSCVSSVYNPPHCIGYKDGEVRDGFTIPCGRGSGIMFLSRTIAIILTSACPPIVIGGSLFLIYRSVRKLEKKMSKYGVGTLRTNVNLQQQSNAVAQTPKHSVDGDVVSEEGIRSSLKKFANPIVNIFSKSTRPSESKNIVHSKSRVVMHKAIAYSISYFLTWTFLSVYVFREFVAKKEVPITIRYLSFIFVPLQGLYNLTIYLFPKVIDIKNKSKKEKVTWGQAIIKAFCSRGPDKNVSRNVRSRQNISSKRKRQQDKPSQNRSKNGRDRILRLEGIQHEEEKTDMVASQTILRDKHNAKSTMYEQNIVTNSKYNSEGP